MKITKNKTQAENKAQKSSLQLHQASWSVGNSHFAFRVEFGEQNVKFKTRTFAMLPETIPTYMFTLLTLALSYKLPIYVRQITRSLGQIEKYPKYYFKKIAN